MGVSKNRGTPEIIHLNKVFHRKNFQTIPFWGTPIFFSSLPPTRVFPFFELGHPRVQRPHLGGPR